MFFGSKESPKPYRLGFLTEDLFIEGDTTTDWGVMNVLSRVGGGSSVYMTGHLDNARVRPVSAANVPERSFSHYLLPSILSVMLVTAMDAEAEKKLLDFSRAHTHMFKVIAHAGPYQIDGEMYRIESKFEEINLETSIFTLLKNAKVTRIDEHSKHMQPMTVNVALVNSFQIQGLGQ